MLRALCFYFLSLSDISIGLRLQQIMKSQWQTKSLERSKPLKKLSLKHKLSSSKEKHKFTNSLMAVSKSHFYDVIDWTFNANYDRKGCLVNLN